MDFDDMLIELGELGKFQVITYLLVCLPVLFAAANSLSYVFTAGIPKYRCYIPECEDAFYSKYEQPWLQHAIPGRTLGVILSDTYEPSLCERYMPVNTSTHYLNHICTPDMFTTDVIKCNQWIFDDDRTIVTDWNITCLENQWMLSFIGTMHFAGIIVGSALFGILADRFGRKLMFIISIVIMAISGVAQVVSPEYITFAVLVFVNSVGTAGVYPLAFIIGVELVGRKKRETTGIVLNYFYAIGEALVALFAWLTKDWVQLQLLVAAPSIVFVAYYWLIPESVRWLLAKQKGNRAKEIVCRAAKMNGVTLSESLLSSFESGQDKITKEETQPSASDMLPIVKTMLKSRKILLRFMIVLFIWATNAFVYYGLSLNSTSMIGNKYLNFALVCLIEIPGYSLAWVCIQYFGRRLSLVGSLFLCGCTCIGSVLVPQGLSWAVIILFLIGKLGITSSFGVVFVYTAELLPTAIRSGGVGTASTTARFGALVAPFVPLLGVYVQPLPMILFGVVSVIAGLLALKLPETLGIKLPDTVQDAIRL
ncbi:uncharacterized protein CBL_06013 [Carabus blaptoides fortunei]